MSFDEPSHTRDVMWMGAPAIVHANLKPALGIYAHGGSNPHNHSLQMKSWGLI